MYIFNYMYVDVQIEHLNVLCDTLNILWEDRFLFFKKEFHHKVTLFTLEMWIVITGLSSFRAGKYFSQAFVWLITYITM